MDAKVGDWVVTPRRGKAVEINALWYNALRLMQSWTQQHGGGRGPESGRARATAPTRRSIDGSGTRHGGYLYDVIDGEHGNDACCRPNQVFAISLPHPVLDRERWEPVLECGARSVAHAGRTAFAGAGHPDYKARYYGDLRARDAAYHQGTVWAWLIGPYIDAEMKLPRRRPPASCASCSPAFDRHLDDACVGQISEVFDAEAPFLPRGCVAQAWSVAEVLRCWLKLA